jgi:hypothetical protein
MSCFLSSEGVMLGIRDARGARNVRGWGNEGLRATGSVVAMASDRRRVDRSGRFDPETFSERKFLVKDDYGRDIGGPPGGGVNSVSLDPPKLEPIRSDSSGGRSRYTALERLPA